MRRRNFPPFVKAAIYRLSKIFAQDRVPFTLYSMSLRITEFTGGRELVMIGLAGHGQGYPFVMPMGVRTEATSYDVNLSDEEIFALRELSWDFTCQGIPFTVSCMTVRMSSQWSPHWLKQERKWLRVRDGDVLFEGYQGWGGKKEARPFKAGAFVYQEQMFPSSVEEVQESWGSTGCLQIAA